MPLPSLPLLAEVAAVVAPRSQPKAAVLASPSLLAPRCRPLPSPAQLLLQHSHPWAPLTPPRPPPPQVVLAAGHSSQAAQFVVDEPKSTVFNIFFFAYM